MRAKGNLVGNCLWAAKAERLRPIFAARGARRYDLVDRFSLLSISFCKSGPFLPRRAFFAARIYAEKASSHELLDQRQIRAGAAVCERRVYTRAARVISKTLFCGYSTDLEKFD